MWKSLLRIKICRSRLLCSDFENFEAGFGLYREKDIWIRSFFCEKCEKDFQGKNVDLVRIAPFSLKLTPDLYRGGGDGTFDVKISKKKNAPTRRRYGRPPRRSNSGHHHHLALAGGEFLERRESILWFWVLEREEKRFMCFLCENSFIYSLRSHARACMFLWCSLVLWTIRSGSFQDLMAAVCLILNPVCDFLCGICYIFCLNR